MKIKNALSLAIVFTLAFYLLLSDSVAFAAPKKLKLNVKKLNLTVGSNYQLRVYNLKKNQKISFSSSNPKVVSLQTNTSTMKKVTVNALAIGNSTITATIKRVKKAPKILKCKVRVSPNAVGIKFMKRYVKIGINEKFRLETVVKPNTSLEHPIFESDNPNIATVNSRGIVTAIAPGKANITATLLSSNISTNCTITVLQEKEKEMKKKPFHLRNKQ